VTVLVTRVPRALGAHLVIERAGVHACQLWAVRRRRLTGLLGAHGLLSWKESSALHPRGAGYVRGTVPGVRETLFHVQDDATAA